MNFPPAMSIRHVQGKSTSPPVPRTGGGWRVGNLLLAPHRLGFFLAVVVLMYAAAWWALVQVDRVSAGLTLPYAMSPSLGHAAVMTFGFIPLFFSGFLFTAGPKWLGVEPLDARQLLVPLLLLASGWLLWVTAQHIHTLMALTALLPACAGLMWMTALFWRFIRRSDVEDQLHARVIGLAFVIGCLCVTGLMISLALDATDMARAFVLSGLWGFVVPVYVSVAHRMIPFFTSSAMPFINARRPFWALGLMLGVACFEVVSVWVELNGPLQGGAAMMWMLLRGTTELAAGLTLLWLAITWGLMQSLKNRLLAMLHLGFMWLGLSLVLGGASQLLGGLQGTPILSLGSLHALTMGCLGSLMLAMVTRVSCGHSGRALVADKLVWSLFCLLQVATVLRIGAAAQSALAGWLLLPAALLWVGIMVLWGTRLANWYGRVRADGRPG